MFSLAFDLPLHDGIGHLSTMILVTWYLTYLSMMVLVRCAIMEAWLLGTPFWRTRPFTPSRHTIIACANVCALILLLNIPSSCRDVHARVTTARHIKNGRFTSFMTCKIHCMRTASWEYAPWCHGYWSCRDAGHKHVDHGPWSWSKWCELWPSQCHLQARARTCQGILSFLSMSFHVGMPFSLSNVRIPVSGICE